MAKYQPTIELWGKEDLILSGKLKLQSGQWVTCGGGIKSRYIGTNGRSIDCCHGGDTKQVTTKYRDRISFKKRYCTIANRSK